MTQEIYSSGLFLNYAEHLDPSGGIVITENEKVAENISKDMAFFKPEMADRVIYIPDSETLPFDLQSPPTTIISRRLNAIERLCNPDLIDKIIICSASSLMRVISDPQNILHNVTLFSGKKLNRERLTSFLNSSQYKKVAQVKNPGEWSQRGLVFDIYAAGWAFRWSSADEVPVRISLDAEDTIVSIRRLDLMTQEGSMTEYSSLAIYRNQEFAATSELIAGYRREAFDFHPDPRSIDSFRNVSVLDNPAQLASWLRVPNNKWSSVLHLSNSQLVIFPDAAKAAVRDQWQVVLQRHADVSEDKTRICPPPEYSWLSPSEVEAMMTNRDISSISSGAKGHGVSRKDSLSETLEGVGLIAQSAGRTLFVVRSQVRSKHLKLLMRMLNISVHMVSSFAEFMSSGDGVYLTHGELSSGFEDANGLFRVITEDELFNESIESRLDEDLGENQRKAILQGLGNIKTGDPLVHAGLGIGRFDGFESIDLGAGHLEDMLKIRFAEEASIFVPIGDLDLVSRYSGTDIEKAPLSKINDPAWLKGLSEAQQSSLEAAKKLVAIRDRRVRSAGTILGPASESYSQFCEMFRYAETPDQKRAIIDIEEDLTSGKPMDRLVCGDVGFGKTEVAMRAAFLVADKGYQVAFLAPTTLLAEQHYQSVIRRFDDTGIKSILISGGASRKSDMDKIASGEVSIVIGAHRLLQADMKFHDLGLIIIDEEHRFGVKQKELLRTVRGNKHTLALAATPIPRTMSLAMSGIRDISIIATPPLRRLSIRTLVRDNTDSVVREAISRELNRSGQVFFLHNRIGDIDESVQRIQALSPNARIAVLHSRLGSNQMASVMQQFRDHDFDILVTTTVIEVGIDIPNANTLIVEDAGNLGLAQLHQLRGRVGRSNRQAYTYLLTSNSASQSAERRLKAMEESSSLGEGALIARQDMEIRGIGEVLGEEQSGHIHNIGFTLYMRLLGHAIKSLDNGAENIDISVLMGKVSIPIQGYIPSSYIPDPGERLTWYQRLMSSESMGELEEGLAVLKDAYGYLPEEVNRLKEDIISHLAAKVWAISSVKNGKTGAVLKAHHYSDTLNLERFMKLTFGAKLTYGDKPGTYLVDGLTVDETMKVIASVTDLL